MKRNMNGPINYATMLLQQRISYIVTYVHVNSAVVSLVHLSRQRMHTLNMFCL